MNSQKDEILAADREAELEAQHGKSYSAGYKDGWRDGRLELNNPTPASSRTNTPLTDAQTHKVIWSIGSIVAHPHGKWVPADHARQLETRLAEATEALRVYEALDGPQWHVVISHDGWPVARKPYGWHSLRTILSNITHTLSRSPESKQI